MPGTSIGHDVREIYVIEESFNHVNVDLKELRWRAAGPAKAENLSETKRLQKATTLPDVELFNEVAQRFKDRSLIPLRGSETWYDLDRSLKPWFDLAMQRLQAAGKADEIGLLQYRYQNVLHFARGINIRSFRGFADSLIATSARKHVADLAKVFGDLANTKLAEADKKIQPKKKDGQGKNDNDREIDSETKEQKWREEAPEYIPNADALRMADDKISAPVLSKFLRKPGNTIRWMRNKETRRSKVHTQDFRKYIKTLKSPDEFSDAAFKQRERQQEIDRQKRSTGK